MSTLLSCRNLGRKFGGLSAVSGVNLKVKAGEILGIIGPNGAGKTTLFNLLSGFLKPTTGTVHFDGHDISGLRPHRLNRMGLSRTFQLVRPFPHLTVLQNVMIATYRFAGSKSEAAQLAHGVLQFLELDSVADRLAAGLTTPSMKRLEVARALATRPKLLLLDEVMSGLTPTESKAVLPLIRNIRDSGVSVLMIEHVMHAIMALSDRILVLHHGERLAEGTPVEVAANPSVIAAYLGTVPVQGSNPR